MLLFQNNDVINLNISIEEAFRVIISLGILTPTKQTTITRFIILLLVEVLLKNGFI